mgnify:CR=1 FL=1
MKILKITPNSLLLFALLFVTPLGFAQENGDPELSKKEKIERLKIAFITKELDLSVEDSEKFWPVYNEMEKKIGEEKKARKKTANELKENLETLSEDEIKTKTTSVLDNDIKMAELKKEYNDKIATIIGYKKATKLLSLEARFKRELLKKLNEGPQTPPHPGGRKPGGKPGGPRTRANR